MLLRGSTRLQTILLRRTDVSLCTIVSDQFSACGDINTIYITKANWWSSTGKEDLYEDRESERERERETQKEEGRES